MKKTLNKGFTLIELLVVVAIIGILASVILASLNSARAKGVDAATKSDLANARAQAEIYYDANGNSYSGVCTAVGSANGINDILNDMKAKLGTAYSVVTASGTGGSVTSVTCHDSATAWAAQTPLKVTGSQYFCVDSTGATKGGSSTTPENTALAGGATVCP